MCVGSEVTLTPMRSVWGLISIVRGVGADEYRTPLLCFLGERLPGTRQQQRLLGETRL